MTTNAVAVHSKYRKLSTSWGHLKNTFCVTFDHTSARYFTGSDDRLIKMWCTYTGKLLASFRAHSAEISDLVISPDNKLIASASNDKLIRLWNMRGRCVAALAGHQNDVMRVRFNPHWKKGQKYLISASLDGQCMMWDCENLNAPPVSFDSLSDSPGVLKPAEFLCIDFHPTKSYFACGNNDNMVRIYCWKTKRLVSKLRGHWGEVCEISFDATGERILTCSTDGTVKIWAMRVVPSTATGEGGVVRKYVLHDTLSYYENPPAPPRGTGVPRASEVPPSPRIKLTHAEWTGDKQYVLTSSAYAVQVWAVDTGDDPAPSIRNAVSSAWGGTPSYTQQGRHRLVHELEAHTKDITRILAHPICDNLALSCGHDGRLVLWDIKAGCVLQVFRQPVLEVEGDRVVKRDGAFIAFEDCAFSPCGRFFAATSGGECCGMVLLYGTGTRNNYYLQPYEQFFTTDYNGLRTVNQMLFLPLRIKCSFGCWCASCTFVPCSFLWACFFSCRSAALNLFDRKRGHAECFAHPSLSLFLEQDSNHQVVDEEHDVPPHLCPRILCNYYSSAYPFVQAASLRAPPEQFSRVVSPSSPELATGIKEEGTVSATLAHMDTNQSAAVLGVNQTGSSASFAIDDDEYGASLPAFQLPNSAETTASSADLTLDEIAAKAALDATAAVASSSPTCSAPASSSSSSSLSSSQSPIGQSTTTDAKVKSEGNHAVKMEQPSSATLDTQPTTATATTPTATVSPPIPTEADSTIASTTSQPFEGSANAAAAADAPAQAPDTNAPTHAASSVPVKQEEPSPEHSISVYGRASPVQQPTDDLAHWWKARQAKNSRRSQDLLRLKKLVTSRMEYRRKRERTPRNQRNYYTLASNSGSSTPQAAARAASSIAIGSGDSGAHGQAGPVAMLSGSAAGGIMIPESAVMAEVHYSSSSGSDVESKEDWRRDVEDHRNRTLRYTLPRDV